MNQEQLLMMQLYGRGGGGGWVQSGGWLQVVFLVFLFVIPILWPERIRVVSRFRGAYVLFALSIIIPSAFSVLMTSLVMPAGMPGVASVGMISFRLLAAAGPILFGISLILMMKAIVPGFIPPQSSYRTANQKEPPLTQGDRSVGGNVAESQSS